MVFDCNVPSKSLKGRLGTDYYLQAETATCENSLKKLSLKCLKEDKKVSKALMLCDQNYAYAVKCLETVYEDNLNCIFIGLYGDNGYLIAHSRLVTQLNQDNNLLTVSLMGIELRHKDSLFSKQNYGINYIRSIYSQILTYAEYLVTKQMPEQQVLDFITYGDDKDLLEALNMCGFTLMSTDNGLHFTKLLPERGVNYGRNTSGQ